MKKNKMLTRDEFRETLIKPLEDKFGYKVYWNGKESKVVGLKVKSRCYGVSYTSRSSAPIVLTYRKNTLDMLRILVHEIGHSYLHNKKELGYKLPKARKEVEAESVVIKVFEILKLNYTGGEYIEHYYEKCSELERVHYSKLNREALIDSLVKDIVDILKDKVEFIKSLNSNDSFKYIVSCPICGNEWKYKRKSKVIQLNGKGCWCRTCGKEESLDRLIIEEVNYTL